MRPILLVLPLLAILASPLVHAQNSTNIYNNPTGGGTPVVNINNPAPSESTGYAGFSGTALVVLGVLAVIVVALIVVVASGSRRDRP